MHRFFVALVAATTGLLVSTSALATAVQVTVTETDVSGMANVVASWTQDQDAAPLDYVADYYMTVPVWNASGIGGDQAVTWYSGTHGQLGGFTNFSEDFNILAPASYVVVGSTPDFITGTYYGVDLKADFRYVPASYTIALLNDPLNAAAVAPAVPEPATWAMLFIGLGLIGTGVRLRPRTTPTDH